MEVGEEMMTMEELQKACETLAEAWNKVLEPMEKLAKDLSEAFGRRKKATRSFLHQKLA